jgi:hypothetical protein
VQNQAASVVFLTSEVGFWENRDASLPSSLFATPKIDLFFSCFLRFLLFFRPNHVFRETFAREHMVISDNSRKNRKRSKKDLFQDGLN